MSIITVIRGGGDLASGVALRLHRVGLPLWIIELPQPLVVRRRVSFAEAIYRGQTDVEGVIARRASGLDESLQFSNQGIIPVLVDPDGNILRELRDKPGKATAIVLVDGRMAKRPPETGLNAADLVIGLGPGFSAGENCHAVIETKRGHFLGRVIWEGAAEPDTGIPEGVGEHREDRVLRAPRDGTFQAHADICDHLEAGELIASVDGQPILAPFRGVLRGLLHSGLVVNRGLKVGDLDPRDSARYCTLVSDKSLAVGGGVLEAVLSRAELRASLWD